MFGIADKWKETDSIFKAFNYRLEKGTLKTKEWKSVLDTLSPSMHSYITSIKDGTASMGGFIKHLMTTDIKAKALKISLSALKFVGGMFATWALSAAFSAITNAIEKHNRALEEERQKRIESANAAKEQNRQLQKLTRKYQELYRSESGANELKNVQEEITNLVGVQASNLDLVNGKLDEELNKLNSIAVSQSDKSRLDLLTAVNTSAMEIESDMGFDHLTTLYGDTVVDKLPDSQSKKMSQDIANNVEGMFAYSNIGVNLLKVTTDGMTFETEADRLLYVYDKMVEARDYLTSHYDQNELSNSDLYKNLSAYIGDHADAVEQYRNSIAALHENDAITIIAEDLKTTDTSVINSKESFKLWVDGIIESEGATGSFAETIRKVAEGYFPQFATELNEVEGAVDNASKSIGNLSSKINKLKTISDNFKILSGAMDDFKGSGMVSIDSLAGIAEAFKDVSNIEEYLSRIGNAKNSTELKSAISELSNEYINNIGILQNLDDTNKDLITTRLKEMGVINASEVVNIRLGQSRLKEAVQSKNLASMTTAEYMELAKENGLTISATDAFNQLAYYKQLNIKNSIADMTASEVAQLLQLATAAKASSEYLAKLAQIQAHKNVIESVLNGKHVSLNSYEYAQREVKRLEKELSLMSGAQIDLGEYSIAINVDAEKLNNSFSGNGDKTPAEKYFDDLKHQRELDKINQKEYLIGLYKGYEDYYKDNNDFMDEQASTMEELYNGFKELYKEDFEAKKESLEKQKEEVEKYYDKLIDEIKEANDEEDYEEEQAEKRKTIFELKAKIDDLLRDGSQRALARAAELQEELADAEKELFDFERDNARENEIDRLEKEKESKVEAIENEVKAIDEDLNKIDKSIGNVYQAIVNYAAAYGVTIKPVQQAATGTLNARGGWTKINEKGLELIDVPDGQGNYIPMLPGSKVLTAQQTSTLMALSQGQLPQAMYNSIARSIGAKVNSPAVNNYNQPITINIGDIIVKGNADKSTVADLKKQREDIARIVLETIKPFTR